ncbi:MAG: peptidase M1, partial [Bacteroidetes bacterium]
MNKILRATSVLVLIIIMGDLLNAQPLSKKKEFTHADTLRGTIGPERAWWDVTSYAINIKPDFENKSIEGLTEIRFKVLDSKNKMQVDLQQPLQASSFSWNGKQLKSVRDGNVYWVDFGESPKKGTIQTLTIKYSGIPRQAVRPPWDGGWIWTRDKNGNPWMSVACQGLGASV